MSKLSWFIIAVVLLLACTALAAYRIMPVRSYPSDPNDAQILFDDLDAFADAHRVARNKGISAKPYAELYYNGESDRVESLVWMVEISAEQTAEDVRARAAAYDEIVQRFAGIKAAEPAMRSAYRNFKVAYPRAVFSPVYFAYSGFRARGLIRPYGIIIGGEYFVAGDDDQAVEGWPDVRGLMVSPEHLPSHLVHEAVHIQQARNSPLAFVSSGKVLNWSLYEGTADFVAATITGTHTNPAAHAFLEEEGDALWCEFYRSIDASRRTYWMDSDVFGIPPGGFVAAFGYEISAAYYEQHDDKRQALIDLIELADYQKLFNESGYALKLETLCNLVD